MIRKSKLKKNKNGLVIEEDLAVNKLAGFKAVKRDKSVNRRAGLHDKKKDMQGDSKVLKHRPLALKRKRIARKVAAVLSVVFVGAVSYVGVGFLKKDTTPIDDPGFATVRYAAPASGKPTDYTVVENVAYLNYVLHNQKFWSSSMNSTVYNSFMNQTVDTYKQYYNGVLISEDVEAGFSSKITQFCIPEDVTLWRDENGVNHGVESEWAKRAVLWRGGSGGYKGLDTNWSSDPASGSVITSYRKERGLPSSEFSVYVLNELTVKNAQEKSVVDNGDGTYTVTLHLNVNPEGETSAVYYYKQQMKSKGGLSEMPKYSFTDITFVFDENWRVLESDISDGYQVKMGISVSCTSKTHTVYSYDDEQTAKETVEKFYNGYFINYKDKFSNEVLGDPEPDAATMLATAFGSVMTGDGATFKLDLGLNGKSTQGYAFVGMQNGALNDLRVKLGKDISAYLVTENGKQAVYLALGSNAKIKLGLDELSSALAPKTPSDPDTSNSETSDDGEGGGFDVGELINQVLGGELTLNEAKTKATFKTEISIFGVTAKLNFYFDLDGEEVSLDNIDATILVGASNISVRLRFADNEKPKALSEDEESSYQDVLKNGLSVSGKLDIKAGGQPVSLILENCALSLNGGISLALKAKIISGNKYNDIYARYAGGKLTFVYGDAYAIKTIEELVDGDENSYSVSGNFAGAVLDIEGGDLRTLESAVVALYNRIIGVANGILESGDLKTCETLDEIIQTLSGGKSLTSSADAIFKLLKLSAAEDGKYTVESVLSGLNLYATGNDIGIKLGALGLEFGFDANGSLRLNLALNISDSEVALRLSDFSVTTYETVELSIPESELLTASDFAEMLDYLGAAAELLVQENLTAELEGSVDLGEGAGYAVNAKLQYSQGANGFPVHINAGKVNKESGVREGVNFWIDSSLYTHFNLKLVSKNSANDSVFVDFYILDANPSSTTDGKTDGAYTQDGKLDIYFSLSKYDKNDKNYNPLMLYMPVEDLLTIATMGVSMLDIGGLDFSGNTNLTAEQIKDLNDAVREISSVLNQLLVSKYLAADADRYASLGDSIINQILSSLGLKQQNLQQLLNFVIDGLFKTLNGAEGDNEVLEPETEISEGNYIKRLSLNGGLNLVLNSASIYGGEKDDLSVLISKQGTGECSRITGVNINSVYFGENNENKLDLALDLTYNKVELPASLSGFKNFGNLDTLVKAFVNSATHETTQAEYASGVTTDYTLNKNFCIAGNITISVPLVGDIPVTIEGFSVNIDNNNKVDFNIRIALQPKWGLIDGETYVDFSIKDDMIFIKRTLKSKYGGILSAQLLACNEVEYRIMPLSAFTANMMDNLTFILNVGDTVASALKKIDMSGTNKEQLVFNDYGDYISSFISLYEYNSTDKEWNININGDTISKMSGVTLKDIGVKFKAEEVDELILIKSLSVSCSLFGAIGVSGNLVYCNPQYDGTDGYEWKPVKVNEGTDEEYTVQGDKTVNLITSVDQGIGGYSWAQILGGTKFEDISAFVNWAQLIADTGKTYLGYNPANGTLAVAEVTFEKALIGGGAVRFGNTATVLYNTANGNIYTYYIKPDIGEDEMPLFNGVAAEWENKYRVDGDKLIIRAVYNVSYIQSEYKADESFVWNDILQSFVKTYEIGASGEKIYLPKDVLIERDGAVYGLNRYIDASNGGASLNLATYTDENGKEWFVINADEKFAVEAVWERVYSVAFSYEVGEIENYYYAGTVLTEDNTPAIPAKDGCHGVWLNETLESALGFTVTANEQGFVFTVDYRAFVNISSNIALDGVTLTVEYEQGATAELPDISGKAADKTYYFDGYYLNADYSGEKYEGGYSFTVLKDTTYYAKWLSKTITLNYNSDIEMTLTGETQPTFDYNADGGALAGCTATDGTNLFIGWFVMADNGSYAYVSDFNAIRTACRGAVEAADKNADIAVWAVFVTDVEVTINNAGKSWGTWTIGGSYTGGEYASDMSRTVAESAGVTRTAQVRYELNDKTEDTDGTKVKDKLNSGKWYTLDANDFSKSGMTTANLSSYGGARVKVTFECSGGLSQSVEKSAFKKK